MKPLKSARVTHQMKWSTYTYQQRQFHHHQHFRCSGHLMRGDVLGADSFRRRHRSASITTGLKITISNPGYRSTSSTPVDKTQVRGDLHVGHSRGRQAIPNPIQVGMSSPGYWSPPPQTFGQSPMGGPPMTNPPPRFGPPMTEPPSIGPHLPMVSPPPMMRGRGQPRGSCGCQDFVDHTDWGQHYQHSGMADKMVFWRNGSMERWRNVTREQHGQGNRHGHGHEHGYPP